MTFRQLKRRGPYKTLWALIFAYVPRAPIYRSVCKDFNEILWSQTFLRNWERKFIVCGPHGMLFIAMPVKIYNARHKETCHYNSHEDKFECDCLPFKRFKRKIDIMIPYSGFLFPDEIRCPDMTTVIVPEYSHGNLVAEYELHIDIDTDRDPCVILNDVFVWHDNCWWEKTDHYFGFKASRPYVIRNHQDDMAKKNWIFYPKTVNRLAMWVTRDNHGHLRYFQIENNNVYQLSLAGRHLVSPSFKLPFSPHDLKENKLAAYQVVKIAKQICDNEESIALYNSDPVWQKIKYYNALLRKPLEQYSYDTESEDWWSDDYDEYEVEMEREEEQEYLRLDDDIYRENIFEDIEMYEDSIDEKYADLINTY